MADARPLSWQSAFWGLAGIALNTMFQDGAGYFANMPDLPVYVPRASPVACLADICDTLFSTLRLLRTHRWIGALRVVVVLRYQHEERSKSEQTLGEQAKNAIICAIACLQAVKLLSCTGIGWTKTCAVIYMLSWMTELLLRRIHTNTPNYVRERIIRERGWIATELDEHPDPDRPWITPSHAAQTRYLTARKRADLASASNMLALGAQVAVWLYIIYRSLPPAIEELSNPMVSPFEVDTSFFVKWVVALVCIGATSYAAFYYTANILFALDDALDAVNLKHPSFGNVVTHFTMRRWIIIFIFIMMIYIPTFAFFPDFWLPIIIFTCAKSIRFTFAWAGILLTIYLTQIVLGVLLSLRMQTFSAYRESRQATRNTRRYLAFLVVQISVTLLYYCRLYDEKTTHKPGFTEWLG